MIVYLDSSIVLGMLTSQTNRWKDWGRWEKAYSSALLYLECRRVVDRWRLKGTFDEQRATHAGEELRRLRRVITRIALTPSVIERASLPMPTLVKTLDAIHLATALMLRERLQHDVIFVTHDAQQATAARALNFETAGSA